MSSLICSLFGFDKNMFKYLNMNFTNEMQNPAAQTGGELINAGNVEGILVLGHFNKSENPK